MRLFSPAARADEGEEDPQTEPQQSAHAAPGNPSPIILEDMSDQEGMGSASIQGGGDADAPFGARQIGSLALCAVDLLSWLSSPLCLACRCRCRWVGGDRPERTILYYFLYFRARPRFDEVSSRTR